MDSDWPLFNSPANLEEMPLRQRRALVYYFYRTADKQFVSRGGFTLISRKGPEGSTSQVAREIADKFGGDISSEQYSNTSSCNINHLRLTGDSTFGALAWRADWVISRYPDFVAVEPSGILFPASAE